MSSHSVIVCNASCLQTGGVRSQVCGHWVCHHEKVGKRFASFVFCTFVLPSFFRLPSSDHLQPFPRSLCLPCIYSGWMSIVTPVQPKLKLYTVYIYVVLIPSCPTLTTDLIAVFLIVLYIQKCHSPCLLKQWLCRRTGLSFIVLNIHYLTPE